MLAIFAGRCVERVRKLLKINDATVFRGRGSGWGHPNEQGRRQRLGPLTLILLRVRRMPQVHGA